MASKDEEQLTPETWALWGPDPKTLNPKPYST